MALGRAGVPSSGDVFVGVTGATSGFPSPQPSSLHLFHPGTGELARVGVPVLPAWISDDEDSLCHVCGCEVPKNPSNCPTAKHSGSQSSDSPWFCRLASPETFLGDQANLECHHPRSERNY